jgi:hypothetical protein
MLGGAGQHVRSAVGVTVLSRNAPIQIEFVDRRAVHLTGEAPWPVVVAVCATTEADHASMSAPRRWSQ